MNILITKEFEGDMEALFGITDPKKISHALKEYIDYDPNDVYILELNTQLSDNQEAIELILKLKPIKDDHG